MFYELIGSYASRITIEEGKNKSKQMNESRRYSNESQHLQWSVMWVSSLNKLHRRMNPTYTTTTKQKQKQKQKKNNICLFVFIDEWILLTEQPQQEQKQKQKHKEFRLTDDWRDGRNNKYFICNDNCHRSSERQFVKEESRTGNDRSFGSGRS